MLVKTALLRKKIDVIILPTFDLNSNMNVTRRTKE